MDGKLAMAGGVEADRFWVSVNTTTGKVRIHRHWRPFCNDGQGVRKQPPRRTRWLGPFQARAEALTTAEKLRKEDTGVCGFCTP